MLSVLALKPNIKMSNHHQNLENIDLKRKKFEEILKLQNLNDRTPILFKGSRYSIPKIIKNNDNEKEKLEVFSNRMIINEMKRVSDSQEILTRLKLDNIDDFNNYQPLNIKDEKDPNGP